MARRKNKLTRTYSLHMNGTEGNDRLYNPSGHDKVTIQALGGNDTVDNVDGGFIHIHCGTGDDIVNSNGYEVQVYGEDGNDSISVQKGSSYSTVAGGEGNDTLITKVTGGMMYGDAGDDYISNYGSDSKLYGGAGDDSIFNLDPGPNPSTGEKDIGKATFMDGGDGNDYIRNDPLQNVEVGLTSRGIQVKGGTINGGAGNDSIDNKGLGVIINGGTGDDQISLASDVTNNVVQYNFGYGRNVVVVTDNVIEYNEGDGNDTIQGFNSNSSLKIGDGTGTYATLTDNSDVMVFVGNNVIVLKDAASLSSLNIQGNKIEGTPTLSGTDGDDSINYNFSNVVLDTGEGNDTVTNSGTSVSINAGNGNDSISNNGANVTITSGKGDDQISLASGATNNLIQYASGDGNDTIQGFNSTSSLKIGDGKSTYSTLTENSDVIVFAGNGVIVLKDAASLSSLNIQGIKSDATPTIKGADMADSFNYNISNFVIASGKGNDTITTSGTNVSINSGGDNDLINNYGARNKIDGGDGDDTISSYARDVSVNGGNGDDSITNSNNSNNSTIIGGAGNDSIDNRGSDVTIEGGTGDDQISLASDTTNNLIQYNLGDGNDVIEGFNSTSTLQIGDGTGTYMTTTDNSDVTVFVGNNGIVLKDAASLSSLNIQGNKIEGTPTLSGTNDNDSITSNFSNVIINGRASNDLISLASGAKNNLIQYAPGDGNDMIYGFNSTATLKIGDGTNTYATLSKNSDVTVFVGNNAIVLKDAASLSSLNIQGTKIEGAPTIKSSNGSVNNNLSDVIVAGGAGNDKIINYGINATINGGDGNDSITNRYDSKNVIINGDSGDDHITNLSSLVTINGNAGNDSILNWSTSNWSSGVSINAGEGNDSVTNRFRGATIDGDAGDDYIKNDSDFVTINGGAGNDYVDTSGGNTNIDGGAGDDQIRLSKISTDNVIQYKAGDGNDTISNFDKNDTLAIASDSYSTVINGNDVIVTVGENKITLKDGASLVGSQSRRSSLNIVNSTHANFTIRNFRVTYESDLPGSVIINSYRFNPANSLLTLNDSLKNYTVTVKNEDKYESAKMDCYCGSAILNSGSTLEYRLVGQKNNLTLTSKTYGDKITFRDDASFIYGEIGMDLLKGSVISTKGEKEISFDNNSSANITAPEGAKININASKLTVNDLSINSTNGAGTITVEKDGMSFEGYGVQFVDLEVAMESYFSKLAPMTVNYNSADKSYTINNAAQVKTLSDDFTKLTLALGDDTQAGFKVNGKEFLVSNVADNLNVVEAKDNTFKIQSKEIDLEKVGRVTIGEQLTFNGTAIDFDGVKVNYALNKPVSYSLDGKTLSIDDAATVTTGDETKTITCAAGSYVINGRSFETSTALTFTADTNEIKIPLTDARTEIYFDGVKVSGVADGGEVVFDLANDKISIPDSASLNITSSQEIKLNLAAGGFTIDGKRISIDNALEITADKDNIKVPLSDNLVAINDAIITGTATIDNTDEIFFSIRLPDGALVGNVSDNTFELNGKDSFAYFGDANKKVQLTEDSTAYIGYDKENGIVVGLNALLFEQVEILGNDAWTVETSGTGGIDKITGIKSGATISTSTEYVDTGDLRFEVETDGAGDFTICGEKITATDKNTYVVSGNSNDEIKVAPLAEEYSGDDSEAAGKIYQYDAAGDYTVNGVTFHATENSKVQTITRGVEFDLSTGAFEYDGLTLNGNGSAQINRYNARLISLTDGAKVSSDDESKYNCRQFEINGAVELIGKKFETNQSTRCAMLNISDTIEGTAVTLTGFVVGDEYVEIQSDCYDSVKIVDGKIATIAGVKATADIYGNGLANASVVAAESGEFAISGKMYKISDDSDGVTFVMNSHSGVAEINGLVGSVEGNFENEISVNGKAVRLTGASSIKITSDGTNITEISNVEGDLVTIDDKTYRKDVRAYELGGAEKLTTSADGTIIFSGNKFETSAGKTFTLDTAGNVSEIDKNALVSANAADAENLATINLSTTDGLEEVIGDFSEGITVNGVFVKVTDSTNFVVKNDEENVYIETTAADLFTINGKTFETYADKTIFKLDASGNVSEIVTDRFLADEDVYLIDGDFNDAIIFNGKKICVTGTNAASIFVGEETLIGVELAGNTVEVVESGGAEEIAISGAGEITIDDKTFSTSEDFVGFLQVNSAGNVYSSDYFIGTLSGKLGGLEIAGLTITTDDEFSATSDGEKLTALENLQDASFTCDELNDMTINGAEVSAANSEEITATITDGALTLRGLKDSAIVENTGAAVSYTVEESGEFLIGETEFTLKGDNSLIFTTDAKGIVKEISGLDEGASLQTADSGSFVVNGATLTAAADDTFIGLANGSAKILTASDEFLSELIADNADAVIVKENITLSGGDVAVVEDTSVKVSITASKGNDTIVSAGENVIINLNKGGNTWLFVPEGKMTIEGYDDTTGAGFNDEYNDILPEIVDKIASKEISFDDGKLTMGAALVSFGDVASKIVNFYDAKDNLQKIGFASDGAIIDANSRKENLILVGGIDSTLLGGAGSDSVFAMAGSRIDAGAGKNYIEIEERGASDDGVTIALNEGKNTIVNFKAGFGDDSDKLFFGVNDTLNFKFDGTDVTVKKNNSDCGILSDVASDAPFVNILAADKNSTEKIVVAQEGATVKVDDEVAALYVGDKSGVDFADYEGALNVNLGSGKAESVGGDILFGGINQVTLGSGRGNLIGSANRETLTAGTGATSIRGGADRDLLIGNTSADKDGMTEFIFSAGDGKDTISNFEFLTGENILTADKISVDSAVTNVVLKSSGDVIVQLGDDWITLEDAQGKFFQINDFTAQVDTNITYDEAANYFLATSKNASVTVGEEAEVWLDGSHGKNFVGNIKTLDASNSDGKNTLAGNDNDNIICAGAGDASLWGGNGNDLLIGGKAHNLFFYTSGNDTIQGANDGDAVILSTVTLDQIASTSITADAVAINFKDGGSLQIDSRADLTYQLADGSQFSANHEQAAWQRK